MCALMINQEYFDCIFYGTGLFETILASALQRVGLSVLLVDRNMFYGSQWATLSHREFTSFMNSKFENQPQQARQNGINLTFSENISIKNYKSWGAGINLRGFQLDLFPYLTPSSGLFINKILSTGIHKYLSFQLFGRILIRDRDKQLIAAPCSRSELFSTKYFTNVEKYSLNKFFNTCTGLVSSPDEGDFVDFMKKHGLSPKLVDYICSVICLKSRKASLNEGLDTLADFVRSAGIYGRSPYLWTLYGCGDIVQAFSRHGAIYGSTCCLNMGVEELVENGSSLKVRLSNGEEISCKHVFINDSYLASSHNLESSSEVLHRTILLTTKSVMEDDENMSVLHEFVGDCTVTMLEMSFNSGVCPKGYFVVHFTAYGGPTDELEGVVSSRIDSLYKKEGISVGEIILWRVDFQMCCGDFGEMVELPPNVFVCRGPSINRNAHNVMEDVQRVFKNICPDDVFLDDVKIEEDFI